MPFDFDSRNQSERPRQRSGNNNGGYKSPKRGSGFQQLPRRSREQHALTNYTPPDDNNYHNNYANSNNYGNNSSNYQSYGRQNGRTARRYSRRQLDWEIPWRTILPIIGVIALLVIIWSCRYAILAFVVQIVCFICVIMAPFLILKWLFFPRR